MKNMKWMVAVVMAAALMLTTACKKGVSTSELQSAFKGSDQTAQSSVDKVVGCVNAGDYAGASAELGKLAGQAKLTPEQQKAISDTLEQVKAALAEKVQKAGQDATKAMGDMQKNLGK